MYSSVDFVPCDISLYKSIISSSVLYPIEPSDLVYLSPLRSASIQKCFPSSLYVSGNFSASTLLSVLTFTILSISCIATLLNFAIHSLFGSPVLSIALNLSPVIYISVPRSDNVKNGYVAYWSPLSLN